MTSRWTALFFVGIVFAALCSTSDSALGHSGGTNAAGCHSGSQPYHCHGSRSAPAPRAPSNGLTLCADGTWSQSTGSGTCSWHGGIAGNNNPSTNSGSTSSGGGTGRIVPGTIPAPAVENRTQSLPSSTQDGVSRAVSRFFDNGGVVYLLIGWWVIAKLRRSRSTNAPKSATLRPVATKPSAAPSSVSNATALPPVTPASIGNVSPPLSKPSNATRACSCGGREVVRRNGNTGQRFVGCSRYPSCRQTRQLRT